MSRLSRMIAPIALLLGVFLAACTPHTGYEARLPAAKPEPAERKEGPVTVALLTPSSSSDQGVIQLGKAIANAARLAERDLNNPELQLRVYDTRGNAREAERAARQALDEGASLIIGPLFGESTKAVAPLARSAGVNVISFSTDSSTAGQPIYLSGFLPENAATRITGYARSRGYEPIAVIYPETQYGRMALAGAEQAAGSDLAVRVSYPRTVEAIPSATERFASGVRETGARGLLLAESGQGLAYLAALLTEKRPGSEYRLLGLGEWDTRSTLDAPELVGGWFASIDPAALRSFVDRYRAQYGEVPPRLAFLGYDAVQIAGQLLEEARRTGANDPFSQAALTRGQGFRGAVGPIRLLSDGTNQRGLAVLEVGRGSFHVIDPAPGALGAGS